jgi:putative two-component system response regulator
MQPSTLFSKQQLRAAPASDDSGGSSDIPGRILIIEDNPYTGEALANLLGLFGHSIELIGYGRAALARIHEQPPELVVLDVLLPDIDGYALCASLKQDPATWDIPVIMVTVEDRPEAQLRGIEAEADAYLHKPVDAEQLAARVRVLLRAKRRNDQLERAEDVIFALARAVEAKDAYTVGHLERMPRYATAIGERMGLSGRDLLALRYGALLHDVGKVGVDAEIIRKDGPLTPEEYALVRQHPLIGERIVQPLRLAAMVGPIVRHHHEHWNGRGYPDGLAGEMIPLGARIVAVADAFDAMTSQRPYNQIVSAAAAAERLREGAGSYWDPQIVAIFLEWLATSGMLDDTLLTNQVGE